MSTADVSFYDVLLAPSDRKPLPALRTLSPSEQTVATRYFNNFYHIRPRLVGGIVFSLSCFFLFRTYVYVRLCLTCFAQLLIDVAEVAASNPQPLRLVPPVLNEPVAIKKPASVLPTSSGTKRKTPESSLTSPRHRSRLSEVFASLKKKSSPSSDVTSKFLFLFYFNWLFTYFTPRAVVSYLSGLCQTCLQVPRRGNGWMLRRSSRLRNPPPDSLSHFPMFQTLVPS
jgi:hypothetical protein